MLRALRLLWARVDRTTVNGVATAITAGKRCFEMGKIRNYCKARATAIALALRRMDSGLQVVDLPDQLTLSHSPNVG